jgi:hypothetical protein
MSSIRSIGVINFLHIDMHNSCRVDEIWLLKW